MCCGSGGDTGTALVRGMAWCAQEFGHALCVCIFESDMKERYSILCAL